MLPFALEMSPTTNLSLLLLLLLLVVVCLDDLVWIYVCGVSFYLPRRHCDPWFLSSSLSSSSLGYLDLMEGRFFIYECGVVVVVVVAVVVVVIVTVCRMLILICARVVFPLCSTTSMSMPVVWFVVVLFCGRFVFRLLLVISFCSIVILRCAIFAVVAG